MHTCGEFRTLERFPPFAVEIARSMCYTGNNREKTVDVTRLNGNRVNNAPTE